MTHFLCIIFQNPFTLKIKIPKSSIGISALTQPPVHATSHCPKSQSVSQLSHSAVSLTLSPVDRGSLLGPSESVCLSLRVAALSDSRYRSLSPPRQLWYTLWTSLKFYVFFKKSYFEPRICRKSKCIKKPWKYILSHAVIEVCGDSAQQQ